MWCEMFAQTCSECWAWGLSLSACEKRWAWCPWLLGLHRPPLLGSPQACCSIAVRAVLFSKGKIAGSVFALLCFVKWICRELMNNRGNAKDCEINSSRNPASQRGDCTAVRDDSCLHPGSCRGLETRRSAPGRVAGERYPSVQHLSPGG